MSTMLGRALARLLKRKLVDGVAARRPPDFIIGDNKADPYLRRWWVIPRNSIFNIYLHNFLKDDDDRALHDHPFGSISLALSGYMVEKYLDGGIERERYVLAGDIIPRGGRFTHRMIVLVPSWTLFVTGPRYREWGFWCENKRFVPWQQFVAKDDKGSVGRGCD